MHASISRTRAPRVLVTGFEPFGGQALNSSGEIVRALEGQSLASVTPATAVLPVVYGAAVQALSDAVARVDPEIVVSLGQADESGSIAVERLARDVSTAEQRDNAGRRGRDLPPGHRGPAVYASTLPVAQVVEELRRAGIPGVLSEDAGGYVCNHLFYGLMHLLATERPGAVGGFVHVPCLPEQVGRADRASLPRETLTRAVEVIIDCTIRTTPLAAKAHREA